MQFNHKNFFKNTYCEFQQVDFGFSNIEKFESKSGSKYHYTKNGVYRYSNHWGRVANCRWKLSNTKSYKNQQWCVGYANWSDFFDLGSTEKYFFITVDFKTKEVVIQSEKDVENSVHFLFSIQQAIRRKKEILQVIKDDKWMQYLNDDICTLKQRVIKKLLNSNKKLIEIKKELRND